MLHFLTASSLSNKIYEIVPFSTVYLKYAFGMVSSFFYNSYPTRSFMIFLLNYSIYAPILIPYH